MPHVLIKLQSGRTHQEKTKLAQLVTKAVMEGASIGEDAVSVAIEDIAANAWTETVYKPDILNNDHLYKKPGYDPL
jgi:4-oxalocrotonate tautomerase